MNLPVLETPRCMLTVLSDQQAPLLRDYNLRNRAHLAPWEPVRSERYFTLEETRLRIATMRELFDLGQALHLAVLDADGGRMIASCNFSNIVRGAFQACHLGYSLDAGLPGRGLMHEALQAGIGHMFGAAGLHRIMANHLPANARSARVLARLGFEREGYARQYLYIGGRWEDHVLNALVNPAYRDPA
jgi:ribosomal-protein-alanine N-acetyltransferase